MAQVLRSVGFVAVLLGGPVVFLFAPLAVSVWLLSSARQWKQALVNGTGLICVGAAVAASYSVKPSLYSLWWTPAVVTLLLVVANRALWPASRQS